MAYQDYKIYKVTDSEDKEILTTRCDEVNRGENISDLKKTLLGAFAGRPNCPGVAAPQVGVNKRVFIGTFGLDNQSVFPRKERNKVSKVRNAVFMINPKLVSIMGEVIYHAEGCLSIPDKVFSIPRPHSIQVEYTNVEGQKVSAVLRGYDAYVFMHELDHLDGKLISDHPEATELKAKEKINE